MKLAAPLTALALALAASPALADSPQNLANDMVGVPVPSEPEAVHYPPPLTRLKVAGIGLLITGAAWGASFASASNWPTVPGSNGLKVPVAGPWIALGKSGCASDDPNCSGALIGVRAALYVLDGIVQIAGLALIAESIVMKTESPAKKSASLLGFRAGKVEVTALPIASPTMSGIGIVGTF